MNRKPPDKTGPKPNSSKRGGFGSNRKSPKKPSDPKTAAKRAALNALKRAQRQADRTGVKLSDWEGEFLGSVADRLNTYGRAFGDPEKGAPGQALSALQTVKLKEITAKAKGEKKELKRKPFKRRTPPPI